MIRVLIASLCIAILLSTNVVADDLRTWTDATGKFKIEAKFVAIENNMVVLEKADGSRINIELVKLSGADQKEARRLQTTKMEDNPFKKADENPFKNSSTTRGKTASTSGTANTVNVDWSDNKTLSVFGSEWKAPAIATSELKIDWQPKALALPSRDFFDKVMGIVAIPSLKQAIVFKVVDKPGNRDQPQGICFVCDLAKGQIVKQYPFTGKMVPLAVSPDGSTIIVREEVFGHDKSNMVELWKISDGKLARVQRWDAVQDDKSHGRDVAGAEFLPDGTLITWLSGGMLTWWKLDPLKPMQSLQLQGGCPGFSADRKYLAGRNNNDLVILDAASGETVAVKQIPHGIYQRFAFSPDGKKLACLKHDKADIYDVAEGQLATSMSTVAVSQEAPCFWSSNNALLCGTPLCYLSPDMNLNVWAYDGVEKVVPMGDVALLIVQAQQRQGHALLPIKLPHQAAVQAVEQAKKDPNFFVLKPGTPVQVDVSGIGDPALLDQVQSTLSKRLKEKGHPVGSGKVTLVASMAPGKAHEVSYRTFGEPPFGRPAKTYTVPGWTYELKLVFDGKTHWTTGGGNHPPPIIHLKQDETIESHLKQYGVASTRFFEHVELPSYVARAQNNQTTGSASLRRSQVTSGGIR